MVIEFHNGGKMLNEKWSVSDERIILDHPYLNVSYQNVRLPDGRQIQDWPFVKARDYVNALVLNPQGQCLILEGYKHGLGRGSWQVLGGYLEPDEDPLAAVQRELLEETGYACDEWRQLGSFVVDANRYVGTGHFFLASNARKVAEPDHDDLEAFSIRWEHPAEVLGALNDGRVAIMSYATNIALGLLALDSSPPRSVATSP
jgi:ADP-ribose pyrophosphatase